MTKLVRPLVDIQNDLDLWSAQVAALKNQFGWNPASIAPTKTQTAAEAEAAYAAKLQHGSAAALAYAAYKLSVGITQLDNDVNRIISGRSRQKVIAKTLEKTPASSITNSERIQLLLEADQLANTEPSLSETVFGNPGSDVFSWWKATRVQASAVDKRMAEELKDRWLRRWLYSPAVKNKALNFPGLDSAFQQNSVRSLIELRNVLLETVKPSISDRKLQLLNKRIQLTRAAISTLGSSDSALKEAALKRLTKQESTLTIHLESVDLLARYRVRSMAGQLNALYWMGFIGDSVGHERLLKSMNSALVNCAVEAGVVFEQLERLTAPTVVESDDSKVVLGTTPSGAFKAQDQFAGVDLMMQRFAAGKPTPGCVETILDLTREKPYAQAAPVRKKLANPGNRHTVKRPLPACPDKARQHVAAFRAARPAN